jgi:hypothetical protein
LVRWVRFDSNYCLDGFNHGLRCLLLLLLLVGWSIHNSSTEHIESWIILEKGCV